MEAWLVGHDREFRVVRLDGKLSAQLANAQATFFVTSAVGDTSAVGYQPASPLPPHDERNTKIANGCYRRVWIHLTRQLLDRRGRGYGPAPKAPPPLPPVSEQPPPLIEAPQLLRFVIAAHPLPPQPVDRAASGAMAPVAPAVRRTAITDRKGFQWPPRGPLAQEEAATTDRKDWRELLGDGRRLRAGPAVVS